jgi:hypothetical protein
MPKKWNFGVCVYAFFFDGIRNQILIYYACTCFWHVCIFSFVADTERGDMRRMWYICCRLPCPSSSVLTELPIHAFNFVCVCHCDSLIKSGVVILSSLMTLLVDVMCACVYFPFITRHNKSAYALFGERARENKPTVLRKQANVGEVRRIGQLTGMFVCPSVGGLYNRNVIRDISE